MKEFTFTVNDPVGIHARPAGQLAKKVKEFADSVVTIEKDGKAAKASQLMKLMSLGVKQGDTVTVKIEGGDEDAVAAALEGYMKENL